MTLRSIIGFKPLALALATGVVAGLAAQALAAAYVYMNGGFGSGDLRSFQHWNVRFGGSIAVAATVVLPALRGLRRRIAAPIAILVGAALGFAFTYYNWKMLGDWFRAWSFPVFLVWAFAATLSILLGLAASRRTHLRSARGATARD